MTDVLSDVLNTVDLQAALYFRTEYHPPFGVAVPAFKRAARFHFIVQGRCNVRLEDGRSVELSAGDLVLVPNGAAHVLASAADFPGAPLPDAIAAAGFKGEGPFIIGEGDPTMACKMVCGHFSFADGADHPLLRAVPDLFHITSADRAVHLMLDDVLRLIVRRTFEDQPGSTASVSRLSEVLFIEVLRAGIVQAPEVQRVMSAVYDPHIGKALALIHSDVGRAWSVESLASAVGMSRSRFAERFRELVGAGPMNYVAEWRLQRALNLVTQQNQPIKAVAHQVGFKSAAAFTRAFSDRFGQSPRDIKKTEKPT